MSFFADFEVRDSRRRIYLSPSSRRQHWRRRPHTHSAAPHVLVSQIAMRDARTIYRALRATATADQSRVLLFSLLAGTNGRIYRDGDRVLAARAAVGALPVEAVSPGRVDAPGVDAAGIAASVGGADNPADERSIAVEAAARRYIETDSSEDFFALRAAVRSTCGERGPWGHPASCTEPKGHDGAHTYEYVGAHYSWGLG